MGMDRDRGLDKNLPLRRVEFHILLSLAAGERHGYGIIQDIEARGFETAKHRSNKALLHAIGLKDNERFLHMNRPK